MPAVVVTGARQTGKSTLVQALAPVVRVGARHDAGVLDRAARRGRKTERQQGEAEDRLPSRVRRPAQAGESLERRDRAGAQESDHRGGLSSRPCAPGERRSVAGMRRPANAAGIFATGCPRAPLYSPRCVRKCCWTTRSFSSKRPTS